MPSTIAVAHYPEGAGHATRMLAIANELERAGAEVLLAGGGAGARFVALNGYDAFEPTNVDFIDSYQDGSLREVVTGSVPASARRVRDYVAWLRETEPDALVTDDMFAAMAAARTDIPLYVLKHDMPALYRDRIERAGARFHTRFQLATAREFFYPAIWPASADDPDGATRVPPVALDGDDGEAVDAADVLLVPSHYSEFGDLADRLERRGHDVLNVGDDDWEATPSLLPYVRGADVVVCSGYSTIMDAAVAGTPCVIVPETDEQTAVADWIERFDTAGFVVAEDTPAALAAVESPPPEPRYDNGAATIATRVMADLDETGTPEPAPPIPPERGTPSIRRRLLGSARRAVTVSAASVFLAGTVAQQVAARGAYMRIERTLPTYAGDLTGLFLVAGLAIVLLAALGAVLDAGLVPSVLLASAPVAGWAINHWSIAPHYSVTFPVEMAVLYGGLFGSLGYLLGTSVGGRSPAGPVPHRGFESADD